MNKVNESGPYIYNAIICKKSINDDVNGLCANMIVGSIGASSFPVTISVSLVLQIFNIEDCEDVPVTIDIKDPSGNIVSNVKGSITYKYVMSGLDRRYSGVSIETIWNNVLCKITGEYIFEVYMNDNKIGECSFFMYNSYCEGTV